MTPAAREQVRLCLLRYLEENPARYGLATAVLGSFLAADGFSITSAELEAELQYLVDKDLIANCAKSISPELRAWRITAAGPGGERDLAPHLREDGAALDVVGALVALDLGPFGVSGHRGGV